MYYEKTNDMPEEEKEIIDEVNMNQAYDNAKENGVHREKYCKCFDCLREAENQEKILITKPF